MASGRDMVVISESGLYKLILKFRKPEAIDFQDRVTMEVLPPVSEE
jgi:prophage antirepressor-like protein